MCPRGRSLAVIGDAAIAVQLSGVRKQYGGLRPLRMRELSVRVAERVSIGGLDAAAAEVFVNLLTGAMLPDEGEILVFGRPTSDIRDEGDWLRALDRLGIVGPRAVLLPASTVRQNLAMPFTLSIDSIPAEVSDKVERLAAEVGIGHSPLDGALGDARPEVVARVHFARALAADPSLLILEHPTVMLPAGAASTFAADVIRVTESRRQTVLAVTEDAAFAAALGGRRLRLRPATGALDARRWWQRWFR